MANSFVKFYRLKNAAYTAENYTPDPNGIYFITDTKELIVEDEEYNKIWLVLYCNDDITKGYSNYKIICLDSEINITNEYGDTMYTVPVKFVNSSSSLVQDLFSFTNTTKGYREPNRDEKIITSDFDFLKKDTYFEYKNKAFEIAGINNISIDGVAYVSISERLVSEPEPRTSADIEVSRDKNFFVNNK